MSGISYTSPRFQAIDQYGRAMAGATLYTYQNKTTTPSPTWRDKEQSAYNTNPIELDARGEAVVWLDPAQVYTFVLRDWHGALVWSQDDVVGSASQMDVQEVVERLADSDDPGNGAGMVAVWQPGERKRTVLSKSRDIADIRDYVAGVGGVETADIQRAIEKNYGGKLRIPGGIALKSGPLFIERGIQIIGESKCQDGAFVDRPCIDFSGELSSMDAGISIGAIGAGDIASILGGLMIRGNGGKGLIFSSDINNAIVDSRFHDLLIYGFGLGIETRFCWGNLFQNIRVQNCDNGVELRDQSNALQFDRLSVVSISGTALQMINAEGVQFNTPELANLTLSSAPVTLFQSSAVMINPYIENVTSEYLAQVGFSSEASIRGSTLIIETPLKMDVGLAVGKYGAAVIRGDFWGGAWITGSSGVVRSAHIERDHTTSVGVLSISGSQYRNWLQYGGADIVVNVLRGRMRLNNLTGGGSGVYLAGNLEVGKNYTLHLDLIRSPSQSSLVLRNGAEQFDLLDSVLPGRNPVTIPFVAMSSDLVLLFNEYIDIYSIEIKSNNPQLGSIAPSVDPSIPYIGESISAPVSDVWYEGDYLRNVSGDAVRGWRCTASGAPGTWVVDN